MPWLETQFLAISWGFFVILYVELFIWGPHLPHMFLNLLQAIYFITTYGVSKHFICTPYNPRNEKRVECISLNGICRFSYLFRVEYSVIPPFIHPSKEERKIKYFTWWMHKNASSIYYYHYYFQFLNQNLHNFLSV